MQTLGEQYKASLARIATGEISRPSMLDSIFETRNRPAPRSSTAVENPVAVGDPATLLRESMTAAIKRAQMQFISGIHANLYGNEFLPVCAYIPHTSACYSFLNNSINLSSQREHDGNPSCLRLNTATPLTQKVVDETWHPFLEWVKEQGLLLHMSRLSEAYGVRHFLVLEVWSSEEENEAEAIAMA